MPSDIYPIPVVGVAARYAAQLRALLALNQARVDADRSVEAASREVQAEVQTSRPGAVIDLRV